MNNKLISLFATILIVIAIIDTNGKLYAQPINYEVQSGDTLSKIAQEYYAQPSKWVVIFSANRQLIKNPNEIQIGWKLTIPSPTISDQESAQSPEIKESQPEEVSKDTSIEKSLFGDEVTRQPVDDIKAAFIYFGPIGDGGWTFAHDRGRRDLEKLPFVSETAYAESVPENEEAEKIMKDFIERGYNLIFTTSFGFMDPTVNVAKEYKDKDIVFMHCSGYKRDQNLGTYFGRIYEPYYLEGMIAGSMTKNNSIGFVAAFPIPEVLRHINAFTLGARSVNPKAVVNIIWTYTWYDPNQERDAAEQMLDNGVDIMAVSQDSPAGLQAIEKRGRLGFGYHSSMEIFAPNAYLTAPIWNWGGFYREVATAVHEGTWKSNAIWGGMDLDMVMLDTISNQVPLWVKKPVRLKQADIISGEFHVFSGPINDNKGNLRVPAGSHMTDQEMLEMDFLVEGVNGEIPTPE